MATKSSRSRTRGNRQQRRADAAGTRRGRAAVRKLEAARGKPHADRLKEERGELNYQFYAELPRDRQIAVADDNERLRQEWIANGGKPIGTNKDNPLLYAYHAL
jgi:hypothetical protein